MREIKFRAWDKGAKKMMNWVDQIHWGNGSIIESVAQTTPLESHKRKGEDIELMQFTGLKDRNGKEIYEGDICKMFWNNHEIIAPMIFSEGKAQFGLEATVDFDSPNHIADVPTPPEVIGNIYENPELIK